MKFNNLPLPTEAPYHIVKLKAEDLLQVKHRLQAKKASSSISAPSSTSKHDDEVISTLLQDYLETLKALSGQ